MALNSRSRYVHLIINDANDGTKFLSRVHLLKEWFELNTDFYAYIYHDMDTVEKNGLLVNKTPHTHIIFLLKPNVITKKGSKDYKRFSTILNEIESACGFSTMLMTISIAKDWVGNCRYLLHLDSKSKYPYERDKVITSDAQMYDNYIANKSTCLTSDMLYNLIEDSNFSLYVIMTTLGLDTYKKYRLVIQDIVKSKFKTLDS